MMCPLHLVLHFALLPVMTSTCSGVPVWEIVGHLSVGTQQTHALVLTVLMVSIGVLNYRVNWSWDWGIIHSNVLTLNA